jgi:diadenylate cyclase
MSSDAFKGGQDLSAIGANETGDKRSERLERPEKMPARRRAEKPQVKKSAKPLDAAAVEAKALEALNRSMLESAARIADRIQARLFFVIVENPADHKLLETVARRKDLVLVVKEKYLDDDLRKQFKEILTVPSLQLSRMGKIKMAVMRSLSARLLQQGDKIVVLTGSRDMSSLDTIVVLDIGKEFELLSSGEVANLSAQVRSDILEQLVMIATEIANQGREGKPLGGIFVLGDTDTVMQLSRQMIFNPFQGYPEEERNILDPNLKDTIREFSALDGAFIIRDDGVIVAAGRHLNAVLEDEALPQGLGARHAAGAGITSVTKATAIVISESTGTVRIFRGGKIFMEIEKVQPAGKR